MANHVEYQKRILPSAFVFSHSPGPNALWHSPCGMLRLFELVDGNPRRVRTTFKTYLTSELFMHTPQLFIIFMSVPITFKKLGRT